MTFPPLDRVILISIDTLRADFLGAYSPELDTSWTIEAAGGSLRLTVGNSLDGSLTAMRAPDGEVHLTRRNVTLRFVREGGGVTGFRADAGRVQNLWFVRR